MVKLHTYVVYITMLFNHVT